MFRISRIHGAVLALCAGASSWSSAQQPSLQQNQQLQKVEVTGSRIKRVDAETPAPVQVITRAQIEQSGATSIAEVLKSLPANNAGSFDENAVASFTPGAGGVSLRGLGAQATLVLVNGRRVAPFGFASFGQTTFVDVNSIPLDAVERIDVLLDGASALYGSDAMAGVINVILRKDFNGLQARTALGQSSPYADGTFKRAAVVWGKGSLATDKYNFFANFEHSEQDPVKANARPRTATADFRSIGGLDRRSSYAYPGNAYSAGTGDFLGPLAGCTPVVADGGALNGRCIYQATDHSDIVADTSRDSLFAAATIELGGGTQLFGDLSLMRTRFRQESATYSSGTYFDIGTLPNLGLLMPADHPQNTFGEDVLVRYRLTDVAQTAHVVNDTTRFVLGARGTWGGWDAETGLLVSRAKTRLDQTGFVVDEVLANEVDGSSTFIYGNPAANDPALMARLYPTVRSRGTTSTTGVDLRGSRDIGQLSGGAVSIALGVETRREAFKSTPDPLISSDAFSVLGASSSDGSRNVSAVYAELSAPVTKTIETQLALRVDHYSDFGTATTPKLGLKWKALNDLALRGTYAEGFRAPSLTELVQSPTRAFYDGIVDPQLCPNPSDEENPNCNLSVEAISGSNPNLKPEKSKSFTVGLVFEPSDNFSISADVFRIKRRNEITNLEPGYLLGNESQYPGYVERDPATGVITFLNLPYSNLGSTSTWGYDIEVKGRIPMAELGSLGLELAYNRQPSYKVQPVADAEPQQWAGFYTQPKERMTFGATWEKGPWTLKGVWNHVGAYQRRYTPSDVECPYEGTPTEGLCRVNAWSTADLHVSYKGFKNLELGMTVKNIDNRQAPIDQRNESWYTGFSSTYHNQLGRFVTLNAKYTFW